MVDGLTNRQLEILGQLPASSNKLADELGITRSTAADHISNMRESGVEIELEDGQYKLPDQTVEDDEPDPEELTDRERYLASQMQQGSTIEELADDVGEREHIVRQHVKDLKENGWQVYIDESSGYVELEGDHTLRSSEHKGTRTRKANKWWELRHNALVREWNQLDAVDADLSQSTDGEDWCLHMTDLHAGDIVRDDDGNVLYKTSMLPDVVDYITEQAMKLANLHGSDYNTAHLLWGGDMVTNEGIYEGQFEDLDAWLDEQHDTLVKPLVRQLKTFAREFDTVQVVCQIGNHGQHRASGTSRQANADLILYKTVRNVVSSLREHGVEELEDVHFKIGEGTAYRNFKMRGGQLKGHLRHGQHRRPQAETSARKKEWLATLQDHDFDVALMGHYHVSGMIPWDGPPIIATSSPKPAGEFVERLGEKVGHGYQDVATVFGVSDEGITSYYPVDMRNFHD